MQWAGLDTVEPWGPTCLNSSSIEPCLPCPQDGGCGPGGGPWAVDPQLRTTTLSHWWFLFHSWQLTWRPWTASHKPRNRGTQPLCLLLPTPNQPRTQMLVSCHEWKEMDKQLRGKMLFKSGRDFAQPPKILNSPGSQKLQSKHLPTWSLLGKVLRQWPQPKTLCSPL